MADAIAPFVTVQACSGFVDLIVSPTLVVSGRRLAEFTRRLERRYACTVSASTDAGSQFVIRLHGASATVAEVVHQEQLDEPAKREFDPAERPLVRYVDDHVAYIDPGHELPLANYLALAEWLAEQSGQKIALAYRHETLVLAILKQAKHERYGDLLREKLNPAYRLAGRLSGGINDSGIGIKLNVPDSRQFDLVALAKLPFVAPEPAPRAKGSSSRNDTLFFNIEADPSNIEEIWQRASAIALAIKVHPLDKFYFHLNERTRLQYTPEPISNWW